MLRHAKGCLEHLISTDEGFRAAALHHIFGRFKNESFDFINRWVNTNFEFRYALVQSLVERNPQLMN